MTDLEIMEKSNSNSAQEKETIHQQDTVEQAMMAWETLNHSLMNK